MELEVENESSVGDTDVSIPLMGWRWKLLRSQECRHREAEPRGVFTTDWREGWAGVKSGSHTITSQKERIRESNIFCSLKHTDL